MSVYLLPLSDEAETFAIELDGRSVRVTSRWNQFIPAWEITLADANSDEILMSAQPVVAGVDLLSQRPDLGFNGVLLAHTPGAIGDADPTFSGLGRESNVYYGVSDE